MPSYPQPGDAVAGQVVIAIDPHKATRTAAAWTPTSSDWRRSGFLSALPATGGCDASRRAGRKRGGRSKEPSLWVPR